MNMVGTQSSEYNGIQRIVLGQVPTSLYSALSRFDIESEMAVYATCPSCNYTHKSTQDPISTLTVYPATCQNQILTDNGRQPCNTAILNDRHLRPLKPYTVPSFRDYLARVLARRDIEDLCDQACDDAYAETGDMRNVFQAEFLKFFKGPIPDKLFVNRCGNVRLGFVMHVDFFNPNGIRVRGNRDSIGVITLALLNLPETLRYQPENLYLCIIPGPREPRRDEINHFTRPIIDEFEIGWERGFHVSRTASSPDNGRDVDIAIIISLNDLPAARKVSGNCGHGSVFVCTRCKLHGREQVYDVNFDSAAWSLRDSKVLRQNAERWRDATTIQERSQIFESHGVQWSEFWRLSYWDQTHMLVVDPMHCLLEGLVHYHCRKVLKIDMKAAEKKAKSPVAAFSYTWKQYSSLVPSQFHVRNANEVKQISEIHCLLVRPLANSPDMDTNKLLARLLSKNKAPLRFVCYSLDLLENLPETGSGRSKEQLGKLLIDWVSLRFLTNF
jgi:Transposase family tnp2